MNESKHSINKEAHRENKTPGPFFRPVIQPKLTINQPNDVYEQEADAVADSIMRMSAADTLHHTFFKPAISPVQRKCAHCEEEEQKQLHLKPANNVIQRQEGNENEEYQPLPPTDSIDWLGINRTMFNRNVLFPGAYAGAAQEEWARQYQFYSRFGLGGVAGNFLGRFGVTAPGGDWNAWLSNTTTPLAVGSALSRDFPTANEQEERRGGLPSPTLLNVPLFNFKKEDDREYDAESYAAEQQANTMAEAITKMPAASDSFFKPAASAPSLRRKCAQCEQEEKQGQRKESKRSTNVLNQTEAYLHSHLGNGKPLSNEERSFFEPKFGYDFSSVRMHTDTQANESAKSLNALAYTHENNIVFAANQFQPGSEEGKKLLAHELTHIVQQSTGNLIPADPDKAGPANVANQPGDMQKEKNTVVHRSAVPASEIPIGSETTTGMPEGESGRISGESAVSTPAPRASRTPTPEVCPPPSTMDCPPATTSPHATHTFLFTQNSDSLNAVQKGEIDVVAASWHTAGGASVIRVDGYASAEGECSYNWDLSCRRAHAVLNELVSPTSGTRGIPTGNIELFAHGEAGDFGSALAPNRVATISLPVVPPPPPQTPPPTCILPRVLGSARGCGSGTDFTHFDFPSISAASTAKLAAWAAAHPLRGPFRSLVTDTECELEMDSVLIALAGASGHNAFARFAAGTGGTEVLGPSTTLGAMALISPSFNATVATVQHSIERQLSAQAAAGALDPCALSEVPPPTFFSFSDGTPLKAVIGGTQGEKLMLNHFTGDIALRTYTIELRFLICDDFGVDEADLYAPGLFPFWVLQHERSASLYAPFINQLDLPVTISGTF